MLHDVFLSPPCKIVATVDIPEIPGEKKRKKCGISPESNA